MCQCSLTHHRPIIARRAQGYYIIAYLLLDGGLSDNLALRGEIENSAVTGGFEKLLLTAGVKNVKKLVILTVNAETSPDVLEFRSDHVPVLSKAMVP